MEMTRAVKSFARQASCSLGVGVCRILRVAGVDPGGDYRDPHRHAAKLLQGRDVGIILDVGANVGQSARMYRRLFAAATIHSFEPFEATYRTLVESTRDDRAIHPHRKAVANSCGSRRLHCNAFDQTNSLFPSAAGVGEYVPPDLMVETGSIEVETTTLDDFCAREGIGTIALLKLDVQGGELLSLQGATGLLGARAIDLIIAELLFAPLYEGQAEFLDVCHFLAGHGYRICGMYDLHYGARGLLGWCDGLFASDRFLATLPAATLR
jgi:FkbM family methyltransferase